MSPTKYRFVLPFFVVLAGVAAVYAQSGGPAGDQRQAAPSVGEPPAASLTAAFIRDADEGNRAGIALATTALAKTKNPDVKALAEAISRDLEQANEELGALAARKHVALASELPKTAQARLQRLQRLSGTDFDEAYVMEVMKDQNAEIGAFELHEQDPDPDVAAWAVKTLPLLQNHLLTAEDAETGIGVM